MLVPHVGAIGLEKMALGWGETMITLISPALLPTRINGPQAS